MLKPLPIGLDDFERIITGKFYYVDKSLFIKEVLESRATATLITRPRRFGKTLNLSMLRYFFEKAEPSRAHLFNNLLITQHPTAMTHQGQYPVIFFTLKFIDGPTWDECFDKIKRVMAEEYRRHRYVLDGTLLDATQKKQFEAIISLEADYTTYQVSLKNLIEYISRYHDKNPILLIDEYDVPIHNGFRHGYYNDVALFMKSFFGDAIKGNTFLDFAVITGALRVAKESIFTGLNNLKVCTFLSHFYGDKFGLLEHEVKEILTYYKLEIHEHDVRLWYNGYTSGEFSVYNPWSIINLVDNKGVLQPYWINTSDNNIIKNLIIRGDQSIKKDLETLVTRSSITKEIGENIVYEDIKKNNRVLWNFLLFTGYLTFKNQRIIDNIVHADFFIPNNEITSFYKSTIQSWIEEQTNKEDYNYMLESLITGDIATFRKLFSDFVLDSFSHFDISGKKPERFYHAFVLGMLVSLSTRYEVKSNRESGYGRYDVMLIPRDTTKLGIVIEFKVVDKAEKETLKKAADNALLQIKKKKYAHEMMARGIKSVVSVGIAFSGKKVLVISKS